jgi:hypothetical protein
MIQMIRKLRGVKSHMRRSRKLKRRAYTIAEIADFSRLLRIVLGIHNRYGTNLLEVFALLQKLFPKLRLRIVANDLLQGGEARAYPPSWIIKIRQSVLDGLLRGEAGARWTLAHELGHVLLQHPGKPFRNRNAANDAIEREAHTFAAEFLAPSEYVKKQQSAEKIQLTCRISFEAAQRRIEEIALEENSKQFGTKRRRFASANEAVKADNLAALIYGAISSTIVENTKSPVQPFKDNIFCTSILVARGSELLSDSYESFYGVGEHSEIAQSAAIAAAILAIRPIRAIGSTTTHANEIEIAKLNEICALRAASAALKINIANLDTMHAVGGATTGPISFSSAYLSELVRIGETMILGSSSIIHFYELPSYYDYNAKIEISWSEINGLKKIINLLAMLK